jgi:hypothetical protein
VLHLTLPLPPAPEELSEEELHRAAGGGGERCWRCGGCERCFRCGERCWNCGERCWRC